MDQLVTQDQLPVFRRNVTDEDAVLSRERGGADVARGTACALVFVYPELAGQLRAQRAEPTPCFVRQNRRWIYTGYSVGHEGLSFRPEIRP